MNIDLTHDPIGENDRGDPVYLKDIWPTNAEIQSVIQEALEPAMFTETYADVYKGDEHWNALPITESERYAWPESDYVRKPPFFENLSVTPAAVQAIHDARCLVMVGDSITTDHISPAGAIMPDSPAGLYLQQRGVAPVDFNSYGSRRGNHEIMMRGTFANVRLKNRIAPDTEGSWTTWLPNNEVMSIYDASERYRNDGTPLIVIAGKEYGSGSSRDWAAKGPALLGVKAVIAQSYERIHRSNLVGMGILPLQFAEGESAETLHLTGQEIFDIPLVAPDTHTLTVSARTPGSSGAIVFTVKVRIDTPNEYAYFQNGGILHYVLRNLAQHA